MFCRKCGKELKDDAVFCSRCGNQVGQGANGGQPQAATARTAAPAAAAPMAAGTASSGAAAYSREGAAVAVQQKKPGGKKKLIIGIAAVAAVALAAVLIVTQVVMPKFSGTRGQGPVYVVDGWTTNIPGSDFQDIGNVRDDRGNLSERSVSTPDGSQSVVYTVDDYGYTTSCVVPDSYDGEEDTFNLTYDNEIDDQGRLTRSVMHCQELGAGMTVSYTYYGDTDNVKSVTYSDFVGTDGTDVAVASTLGNACPDMFPNAANILAMSSSYGASQYELRFSEEGVLQTVTQDGEATYVGNCTLDDLRNKVDTINIDELTTQTNTWDENGNFSSMEIVYDGNLRLSQTVSYAQVESPSRAVAIFDRLHATVPSV